MTGKTHRQYGVCFACLASMLFYVLDITAINYYIALPILLMTSKSGAAFPDVDHTWRNVKDKTVVNKIINVIIHATGGKHRSWQTHSLDICAVFILTSLFLPQTLFNMGKMTNVNSEVLQLLMLGFASGWVSHMIADMFTSEGVRLFCFSKMKVAFVPRKLGPIVFNTGHSWEEFNYRMVRIINIALGVICLIYPFLYMA